MPSNQQKIIEQAKFTYSLLGKTFEKQIKTIKDQQEKQIQAIQDKRLLMTLMIVQLVLKEKEIYNKIHRGMF